jgi:hypothetical protein
MTKATNKKFAGLTAAFPGSSVFSIATQPLDATYDAKSDDVKISKPAVHAAIKVLVVNEIKAVNLPGGVSGLVINGGGANGITFGENDKFLNEMSEMGHDLMSNPETTKKWISDYKLAKDIANAVNESEIMRLETIVSNTKAEIAALKAMNQANDDAAVRYE